MQDAQAQEIESGSAVDVALDQFRAIDLPLDRTVAPGFDDGRGHGCLVLAEPGDKAAETGRGCGLQPRCQSCGISLAQEVGEGTYILGGLPQFRRGNAERFSEVANLP